MSVFYCKTEKRRRIRRIKFALAAFLSVIILLLVLFMRNASAVLVSVSEAAARSYTNVAVAQAVSQSLVYNHDYSSLMTVVRDKNGDISDIIANTAAINAMARQTAYLTQNYLNELTSQGVQIPVGAFTGIDALSGFGFKITVKLISVSAVECSFTSRFTTAGINQTLHSLYINIVSEVNIVTPSRTAQVQSADDVLVCESVIVGAIPDFILGNSWLNSSAALVTQTG